MSMIKTMLVGGVACFALSTAAIAEDAAGAKTPAQAPVAAPTQPKPSATVGQKAPEFTLVDASGKKHSLADYKGKYVVLEWVNFDCPFVKKHYGSKHMQGMQTTYTGQGVVWLSICSSAPGKEGYFEGEALTKRLQEEGLKSTAYLIDADGTVGRRYEATTTPDMFVINPEGVLVYAGAIDDHPSTKQEDLKGAVNYVSEALSLAMSGKPVSTTWTKSYGCSVKYAS